MRLVLGMVIESNHPTKPTKSMKEQTKTWAEFDKAVGEIIKQYPLVKPNSKDVRLCKKLWKEGKTPQYAAGFVLLAHR